MASKLKDLKKSQTDSEETTDKKESKTQPKAETKKGKSGKGNPGNLKPKTKDPEIAKLEKEAWAVLEPMLKKAGDEGILVNDAFNEIWETDDKKEEVKLKKLIRRLLRDKGAASISVPGSQQKKYVLT